MKPAADHRHDRAPTRGHAPHPPRHLLATGLLAALVSLTATTLIVTGLVVGSPAAVTAAAAILLALIATLYGLCAYGRLTIRPPRWTTLRTPPNSMATTLIALGALASILPVLLIVAALLLGDPLHFYPFASPTDRTYHSCVDHAVTADQAQECAEQIAGPG